MPNEKSKITNIQNELRAIYSHCHFIEHCNQERHAKMFVHFWEQLIRKLDDDDFKFYLRLAPHYRTVHEFDSNEPTYIAEVRFSIGPYSL